MSLILSAPPPLRNPGPQRKRGLLLLGSVALHAAVLIPIALHTGLVPEFVSNQRTFEVWIDMVRPDPVEQERPRPVLRPVPELRRDSPTTPMVETTPEVAPPQETPAPERQVMALPQQSQMQQLNAATPQVVPEAAPKPLHAESIDSPNNYAPLQALGTSPSISVVPRPHIEAIDGPARDSVRALDANSTLPDVSNTPATTAGDAAEAAPDSPVPRRARMTDAELAALAQAAAGGTLDGAWVYTPSGGQAGQAGQDGGALGRGGGAAGSGSAAAGAGDIYFRGTPVDCTQPHMLSDMQRLSCDSADARRIQSAIDRGVRVMGTGDGERDTRMQGDAAARARDYDARRRPPSTAVGVVGVEDGPGSNLGMGVAGRHLDPTLRPDSSATVQSKRTDGRAEDRPARTPN